MCIAFHVYDLSSVGKERRESAHYQHLDTSKSREHTLSASACLMETGERKQGRSAPGEDYFEDYGDNIQKRITPDVSNMVSSNCFGLEFNNFLHY